MYEVTFMVRLRAFVNQVGGVFNELLYRQDDQAVDV